MICKACKRDHSPMLTCGRAARLLDNGDHPVRQSKPVGAKLLDKPGFDKVAYQREYMRKRRAAKKVSE
jgi:hypothetical protein